MELTVYNHDGTQSGRTVILNENIFGIEPSDHAIYLDVKQYLANQRQGTHKTKGRSEVTGSTRKLHKQKGTGGSRKGDIKSPLFRGGGRIFGPVPRDYSFKINKKVKKLARKSALTYKAGESNITVLAPFSFEQPRTKSYLEFLRNLNLEGKKTLLVVPEVDRNLVLSSRNIPRTKVALASELNTYMILHADKLLLVESSLQEVENILLD
ncbi:MAG TPA: 50S ribosomal protein L4 [Bacteroidales bacterium]|nr:50S ribosomal protein L4 [Bacteroidales bacterium]